jgi:mono/diheme cytochrome c family protein
MPRILKWGLVTVGALVGLLVVVAGGAYALSERRFAKRFTVADESVPVSTDSATIARGRHIAVTRGCTDCHGADLGGTRFIDAPPLARLTASNLTAGRGGAAAEMTVADWVRAVRHGVGRGGRPLFFMPSHEYNVMGDEDLGALISYLRTVQPVDRTGAPNSIGPVGRLLYLSGKVPLVPAELIDHAAPRKAVPAPGRTAEYGGYLATGCQGCHGKTYVGGPMVGLPPGSPIPANLTPHATGLAAWSEADFVKALRTGARPDGRVLDPKAMPWKTFGQMTDEELGAIWLYLRTLPPQPTPKG